MASARDHYDQLLAGHYMWMAGGFDAAVHAGEEDLRGLGVAVSPGQLAVDLGAGFGMHAIPLANAGARVLAFDMSRALLAELSAAKGSRLLSCIEADLLDFGAHMTEPADLILCLGDTLTHLTSERDVERLFRSAFSSLRRGGQFALTFRDYTTPLAGDQRFIPVRSTPDKIQICFLEYRDRSVRVHDIFHVRENEQWTMHVGSYDKLRLSPDWVCSRLEAAGFATRHFAGPRRMTAIVATTK